MRRPLACALALGLVLAACGGDDDDATSPSGEVSPGGTTVAPAPSTTTSAPGDGSTSAPASPATDAPTTVPPSTAPPPLADVQVTLTEVAQLDAPVASTVRPGEGALYIAEQAGRVRVIGPQGLEDRVVLDISDRVVSGGEQGLLGLAFSPDGALLYADYTDLAGDTVIAEYPFADGVADAGAERVLLQVDQPAANHNGGQLVVTADGLLWIALGDGGGGGDPLGSGQSLDTLLGKILRIDPRATADAAYGIPPDNPFVATAGARPEIWAYGLRNPWRFSFDTLTGDLWIGDVGQDAWEEVDLAAAGSTGGENYGWNLTEGTHPYAGGVAPEGWVPPVYEYSHDAGCSVTGGFVYRGTRVPALTGAYVFADYCAGDVTALRVADGAVVDVSSLGVSAPDVSSFGQDPGGELYVLSADGPVYRIDPAA